MTDILRLKYFWLSFRDIDDDEFKLNNFPITFSWIKSEYTDAFSDLIQPTNDNRIIYLFTFSTIIESLGITCSWLSQRCESTVMRTE